MLITSISDAQIYIKTKSISTDDGLSDKRVTCFFKDKTGFIWIGTKNGLNRYDGHSFKIFRPAAGNSISNEVINDITEDNKGRIWVATMEGLNYYDPIQNNGVAWYQPRLSRTTIFQAILSGILKQMQPAPSGLQVMSTNFAVITQP